MNHCDGGWARCAIGATVAALLLGMGSLHAFAEPAGAMDDEIAHVVQEGDTLEGLARDYLAAPGQWVQLQKRNQVRNPRHLQPGSVVWIPVRLQPEASARVEFVQGQATAQPRGASAAAPVAPGTVLAEGTELNVGPDAFVAVKLADGTVVRVQAQSELQLRQLRRRGRAGSVQSVLEMRKGAVEVSVPPSPQPLRRVEIRTPQVVTSVRGTRFGVALVDAGQAVASVLEGSVAVQPRHGATPDPKAPVSMLAPGQGLAVAADGTVGAARALLAPPDASGIPAVWEDAALLALDMPAQPGAVRYQAQLARDAEFTQVLRHGSFADGRLRWQTPDDGAYYLAVRAVDGAGIAGIPLVRALAIKARPVPPLYQQPAAGAVVATGTGQLQCTQVPGVRWYRLQVAADAQFARPLRDAQRQTTCSLTLADLPAGQYFWRAASIREGAGGQPDPGPFAAAQAFTMAPAPATLAAQSLQAEDGDTTVRLRWPGQSGQRFRLQLVADKTTRQATGGSAGTAQDQPVLDTLLDAPEWVASDLPAGMYQVRIQVQDPTGLQSEFSPPRQIRVGTGLNTAAGLPVSTSSGESVGRP